MSSAVVASVIGGAESDKDSHQECQDNDEDFAGLHGREGAHLRRHGQLSGRCGDDGQELNGGHRPDRRAGALRKVPPMGSKD